MNVNNTFSVDKTELLTGADARRTLTFDLHPLYASILQDGAMVRENEVIGLDGDLRRALIAPFDGTIRLLTTGTGNRRRVRVYLHERTKAYAPFSVPASRR